MTNFEQQTSTNHTLIKTASYLSFSTAIVILLIKVYGWLLTDSQSLLASLIDSLLDISSSFINLIAIRYALEPPDHHHRFGHEKIQDLAIFSQSIFFLASGLFTFFSSAKALFTKTIIGNLSAGTNVMYICIVLTFVLVSYQTYVIKKTGSEMVKVDKLHYFSDLLTNVAVIISINLTIYCWFIDSLFGMAIAIYITYNSYILFKKAFKNLVDEELPEEDRKKIISIISLFKEIKGIHEMKTRYAAHKPFIQCHLEMEGDMSLYRAYFISEEIIAALLQEFPGGEIIIHQDPYGVEEMVNYREAICQVTE